MKAINRAVVTRRLLARAVLAACSTVLVACVPAHVPSGRAVRPGAPQLDQTTPMTRHDLLGYAIKDAIVNGDLPLARSNAKVLGRVMLHTSKPEVQEHLAGMSDATDEIANAPDVAVAARGLGNLLASCASCHADQGGPTQSRSSPDLPVPPRGMRRHEWAIDELWPGIVLGAEDRWRAGAESLADPANAARPTSRAGADAAAATAMIEALGRRATFADDVSARAIIFGDLLATCATCHSARR